MPVLVVGSVGIDTVETPFGIARSVPGGSAAYFALAASLFAPVRLVGVVGEDFPEEHRRMLSERPICLKGLSVAPGKTFRWHGSYEGRMDEATTRSVELNVMAQFRPSLPEGYVDSEFVFLANTSPATQRHVREQVPGARFVMADTMNLWVRTQRPALLALMERVDALVLNDAEARQLSGEQNLQKAARWVCQRGPTYCIVKKAEHGSLMMGPQGVFALPGFPTEQVRDPTGAGDSFAGGLMGYVAGGGEVSYSILCRAIAYGTVLASFAIEDFGPGRLCAITRKDVDDRLADLIRATHLSDL